jgi:glycosyltransferase involved in cell wall biosynthesis
VKLVASMIVRNETHRYLKPCIEHWLTYCDEIRVLDDGSDDGTFEYLGGMRKPVLVKRNPGPSFYEYESKARNELLRWTMRSKPDYVLSIDCDEFVGSPEALRVAMRSKMYAYTLQMEEVWGATEDTLSVRVDGRWGPRPCPILWNAPAAWSSNWEIPDRKLACGREPRAVRTIRARPSRTSVFHFGWTNRSEREARAERYFTHDKGRFHADAHLQSILWDDSKVKTRSQPWPGGLEAVRGELVERIRFSV